MNVEKIQIDDLNLKVVLNITKEDYAEQEKKKLSERRRTAEFKGFRKGMVPMSLIQRVYGDQALYEAVNSVISGALTSFVKENVPNIVGEPLPSEDQPEVEWKSGNDFAFHFDIASTPALDVEVGEKDKLTRYVINVTEAAKKEMKQNMLKQCGSFQEGEAAGEDDFLVADLSNESKTIESAYITVKEAQGEAHDKLLGAKAGDEFEIDVKAAFPEEKDQVAMLKARGEELAALDPVFKVKVVNVRTFVAAEPVQETFDKLFGEDKVHDEKEFDQAVEQRLVQEYAQQADDRLSKDIKAHFMEKAAIALPEAFLKRWLFQINEGKFTMEQINDEFDAFLADYRWQMLRGHIMQKFGVKVDQNDIQQAAEAYVAYQYAMYGMANVPADMLKDAAKHVLSDERQLRGIEESVEDGKTFAAIKEHISISDKKISMEKFLELK